MGIWATHERIPADRLQTIIQDPDADAVSIYLDSLPQNVSQRNQLHLGKEYDWFHRLVTARPSPHRRLLEQIVYGGTSFTRKTPITPDSIGLGEIRYLLPDEVAEISQALGAIQAQELLENVVGDQTLSGEELTNQGAEFIAFMNLYGHTFWFFYQARQAGDGILLWLY